MLPTLRSKQHSQKHARTAARSATVQINVKRLHDHPKRPHLLEVLATRNVTKPSTQHYATETMLETARMKRPRLPTLRITASIPIARRAPPLV
jgi:hypothetical protein